MTLFRLLWITISILAGLAFIWLVLFKIIGRILAHFGISEPCPASISWIVDNPIRRKYTNHVLDHVGLQPGVQTLELGPGPGIFTVEAARRIQDTGRLIVVDIQPKMVTQVEKRIQEAGVMNVETRLASAYELPLPSESIDRAFLITVLQEIPEQSRALAELYRVLKPGGVLSVTEEFMDPDYHFIFETIRQVEKAGFRFYEKHGNWWLYTANFARL